MLINSQCVAEAPSRCAATADPQLAIFDLGLVARVRGRKDLAAGAGWMSGISGGNNAAAGYLLGLAAGFQPGQPASGPAKASTVQTSTDQHNTIQVTRLVPASREGVGPHPGREPGPA